jgi:F0F1-type ATP synthase membrane subunit c/vacuolar-type H+-ATPase subunit K
VFKKLAVALVLVTSFSAANASTSQKSAVRVGTAITSAHTLGIGQTVPMGTVVDRVSGAPEFGTLLFIGTIFVGSAALFSFRRPTASSL